MVVDFFARHTSPQSSNIGDNIYTALASSSGVAVDNLLGNQLSSRGTVVGTLQKEMQDLRDRLVITCFTMRNLVFPTLEFTTKCATL
jgi:hypothetical protein